MEDVAGKVRDDSMDMDRTIGQRSCAMAAMGSCEAPKQRLWYQWDKHKQRHGAVHVEDRAFCAARTGQEMTTPITGKPIAGGMFKAKRGTNLPTQILKPFSVLRSFKGPEERQFFCQLQTPLSNVVNALLFFQKSEEFRTVEARSPKVQKRSLLDTSTLAGFALEHIWTSKCARLKFYKLFVPCEAFVPRVLQHNIYFKVVVRLQGWFNGKGKKLQLGSLVPNLLYRLFFGKRHFSNTFCLGRIFSNRAQAGDATRRGARKVLFKHDDNVLVAKETISRHWSQIRSQTWSFRTGPGEQLGSWFISSSVHRHIWESHIACHTFAQNWYMAYRLMANDVCAQWQKLWGYRSLGRSHRLHVYTIYEKRCLYMSVPYMFPIAGIFGVALILATPKLVACTQGRPSPTLRQHFQHFQHFQRATCHSEWDT